LPSGQKKRPSSRSSVIGRLRGVVFIVVFLSTLIITVSGGTSAAVLMLLVLGAVLLCLCLWLPIVFLITALIIRRARVPARPALRMYDPAQTVLPAEIVEGLNESQREIERQGFGLLGHYQLELSGARGQSYLSIFERPQSHDRLWLMNQFHRSSWRAVCRNAVSLITEFSDGQTVDTSNRKPLVPFPDPPHHRTVWLPNIKNIAKLFDIHTRTIEHLHLNHSRIAAEPDPAEHFVRLFDESIRYLSALGYAYLDEEDNYRFTWKGALVLAFRQFFAPPRVRRRTRRLLAQLPPKHDSDSASSTR
jgi:hypothetical protein